ncbi:MAG: glycosyltransferase family 4 protein [Candidatus Omnitrophica bacterium]|nr:glycosyltransferase family 4 protein [Candidatus Omnitrophota bacterium]
MKKNKILICGILPPPNFGHSMLYKALMESHFVDEFDVVFFNMKFWSYEKHKKVTLAKLFKFIQYYFQFMALVLIHRPRYALYAISFDKMPFLKDFVFCMTARILGCKVVLHDMGQYLAELYEGSSVFVKKLIRWMMRSMTASIVLGEVTRRVYVGLMDIKNVYAVPGAVADSIGLLPKLKRQQTDDKINVLFFSFLQKSKGIWVALQAMPSVIAQNPKVHFTFAGPAESEEFVAEMKEYIQKNNLQDHFEYVGYVADDNQRTEYFRKADVYIFPTLRDVFGLVLLHAMAESCPVVASMEGAICEIVDDGQTGFLFPKGEDTVLAEKILCLAKDSQARAKMGAAGRLKYEQCYTLDVYAQRMVQVFKSLESVS